MNQIQARNKTKQNKGSKNSKNLKMKFNVNSDDCGTKKKGRQKRPPSSSNARRPWLLLLLMKLVICCIGILTHPKSITAAAGRRIFEFTQPSYNASIPENSRGKYFATPDLRQLKMGLYRPDGRTGMNVDNNDQENVGVVKFKIVKGDPDNYFKAVSRTIGDFVHLRVRTQPGLNVALNRELQDSYPLLIKATYRQKGRPNLETRAEVRLRISDQNDLVPLFMPNDYLVKVAEDQPILSELLRVSASDADLGLAGQVSYSLSEPSDTFTIHPMTGGIQLLRRLDYRRQETYKLIVEARDRLVRMLPGSQMAQRPAMTANVQVDVIPSNQFDPHIEIVRFGGGGLSSSASSSSAQILRRRMTGEKKDIALIRVTDEDSSLNNNKQLSSIRLEMVSDDTDNADTDNCDGFFQLIPLTTQSSSTSATEANNNDNHFVLETIPGGGQPPSVQTCTARIHAVDSGYPARNVSINLPIQILDSDNTTAVGVGPLIFRNSSVTLRLRESLPENTPVLWAELNENKDDKDGNQLFHRPSHEQLYFEILPPATVVDSTSPPKLFRATLPFKIDPKSGILTLARQKEGLLLLDYERRKEYRFLIRVTTGGDVAGQKRSGTMSVHIVVLDANDHSPQFQQQHQNSTTPAANNVSIPQNSPVDSLITSLKATDEDSGDNGRVSYHIASPSDSPFVINRWNGDVRIRTSDFAEKEEWKLMIRASDWGRPLRRESETELLIQVIPTTDHKTNENNSTESVAVNKLLRSKRAASAINNQYSPKFTRSSYDEGIFVDETADVGTLILTDGVITANDQDLGYAGKVQYVLERKGNEAGHFAIDTETGDLRVFRPLTSAISASESYELTVKAVDLGRPSKSATATITVKVRGVNNQSPSFHRPLYKVRVSEDEAVGKELVRLRAEDGDTDTDSNVRYYLVSKTPDFALNPRSGSLTLVKRLDRERTPDGFELRVKATDGGQPAPLSSETRIRIEVLDINDNPPRCPSSAPQRVQVPEDWPIGALVSCATASDPDSGINARLSYAIDPSALSDGLPFQIDADTGCVTISSPLDFETRPLYNISLEVSDRGSPQYSTVCSFIVTVLDVNENLEPPKFTEFAMEAQVHENEPSGTEVVKVSAVDPEYPEIQPIYSILNSEMAAYFTIDNDGTVRTGVPLDRETTNHFWLQIEAADQSTVPLRSVLDLYVQVLDRNDHAPLPSQPMYRASVPENSPPGTLVTRVEARDRDNDEDENGDIRYRITRGDPQSQFQMDPKTGYITTGRRKLDREQRDDGQRLLDITISDSGEPRLHSTAKVIVSLLDVNDHAPEFERKIYNFHVPAMDKTADKRSLARVFASDQDSGPNAELSYKIVAQNKDKETDDLFEIDGTTGEISATGSLEPKQQYELTIEAVDGGNPPLSGQTRVVLHVVGSGSSMPYSQEKIEKNKAPTLLTPDPMEVTISAAEDRVGQAVGLVEAEDEDGDQLWFQLVAGNVRSVFALRQDTGELTLAKDPRLLLLSPSGTNDGDEPGMRKAPADSFQLLYTVGDGLSSVEGQTLSLLPYLQIDVSVITADSDGGGTNDQSPWAAWIGFTDDSFTVDLSEKTKVGTVIIHLNELLNGTTAGDGNKNNDDNDNNRRLPAPNSLTYFLHDTEQPKTAEKIKVEARTGRVILVQSLDHEICKEHVLTVGIRYRKQVNYARIILKIEDENDFEPRFIRKFMEAAVLETAAIGTKITEVTAIDRDSGLNGQVSYEIMSGNADGLYRLDPVSGEVFVAKPLSLDYPESLLVVKAVDGAKDPQTDTATLRILVGGSESSAPRFTQETYVLELPEKTALGSMVLHPFAESHSGGVRYELEAAAAAAVDAERQPSSAETGIIIQSQLPPFKIHPSSGAVSLAGPLDKERTEHIRFTIVAKNSMGSAGRATVEVKVTDSNDHAPVFQRQLYDSGVVSENAPVGTIVTIVFDDSNNAGSHGTSNQPLVLSATDEDTGANGMVSYEISDEWAKEFFAVDYGTGAVRTTSKLDYEKQQSYEFTVVARDMGSPHLLSVVPTLVRIRVLDTNDEPPSLDPDKYKATIYLPAGDNVQVTQLRATDRDSVGRLRFKLIGSEPPSAALTNFRLDPESGVITLVSSPTGSADDPTIELEVAVSDGINSASGRVTVTTKPLPESTLKFSKPEYFVNVLENVTSADDSNNERSQTAADLKLGPIESITVLDTVGRELNEMVMYSMVNPNPHFLLNPMTGELSTSGLPLDRERTPALTLVIQARDNRRPTPRIAQTLVHVTVQDVNDSPPRFTGQPYVAVIPLDALEGHNVTSLSAVDRDEGRNGQVLYSLDGGVDEENDGGGQYFGIDSVTGRITVVKPFPADLRSREYSLRARVTDRGEPKLSSETLVKVKVVNKAMPVFQKPFYRLKVSENVSLDSGLLTVEAQSNVGGRIGYALVDGDPNSQFDIDYVQGLLVVKKPLDREEKSEYNLTVRATDISRTDIYSDVSVMLEVTDVNDSPPEFTNLTYSTHIPETVPIGTEILRLEAADQDIGLNAKISYSISGPHADEYFKINERTGVVSLTHPLDYERETGYELVGRAADEGFPVSLRTECKLIIRVDDVNDNPPKFSDLAYEAKINANTEVGEFVSLVSATDPDTVSAFSNTAGGQLLMYSVMDGDDTPNLFDIKSESGLVTVGRSLSEGEVFDGLQYTEDGKLYNLNISVTDGVFTGYTLLNVHVQSTVEKHTGERKLRFERESYQISVHENGPPTVITSVRATGGSPPLVYSFSGTGGPEPFVINPKTGQVSVSESLDYEHAVEHKLAVKVTDRDASNGFAYLTVNVLDKNDNRPVFLAQRYATVVPANVTRGEKILELEAVDPDLGDSVEYSMFKTGGGVGIGVGGGNGAAGPDAAADIWKYFKLHRKRGLLSVRRSLAGVSGQTFSFMVRATDRGNPPLQEEVPVTVRIAPAEDARAIPRFTANMYRFEASEDAPPGTMISPFPHSPGGIKAKLHENNDEDTNEISYRLAPHPTGVKNHNTRKKEPFPFSVNEKTGRIRLSSSLDREERAEYRFMIVASSAAAGSSGVAAETMARVIIDVSDVNDNQPQFQASYHTSSSSGGGGLVISEDAPLGTSLVIISAVDPDLKEAGRVRFSLTGGVDAELFSIDEESGWIRLQRRLDRELKDTLSFRVVARDRGRPVSKSAETPVRVTVRDVNDHAPQFGSRKLQFKLREDAEPGAVFGDLGVLDTDTPKKELRTYVVEGNEQGLFGVGERTGRLHLVKPVDYERQREHRLKVLVTDGTYSLTAPVIIRIIDVNDNAPVCELASKTIRISEDTEVASEVIFTLLADDVDNGKNGRISYRISSDDNHHVETDYFKLDEIGRLTVRQALDRESYAKYQLKLRAEDNGGLYCETALRILIEDVNDNAPAFTKPEYRASIRENLNPGAHFVIRVPAFDPDLGPAGRIQYAISDDANEPVIGELFWMDEITGALSVTKPLDREARSTYEIIVIATDQGLGRQMSSRATVIVNVLDVNDNPPAFVDSERTVKVPESQAVGERLGRVEALSKDENDRIRYSLIGPEHALDLFHVNPEDGTVSLAKPLDYETAREHVLVIEASEGEAEHLRAEAMFRVSVMDENDNAPRFTKTVYRTKFPENRPRNTRVIQVEAFDADDKDGGLFGTVTYQFAATADGQKRPKVPFKIDKENGWIVTNGPIDREKTQEYKFVVEAWDGAGKSDSAAVHILIQDVNDNAPVVKMCSNLTITVQEGQPSGLELLELEISDADNGGNGGPFEIKIHGEGGNIAAVAEHSFAVTPLNAIVTAKELVYAEQELYLLNVEVSDPGPDSKRTECPLTVRVLEESKFPPELSPVTVSVNSYLGEFPGGVLTQLVGRDRDRRDVLRYGLVEDEARMKLGVLLSIEAESGIIRAGPGLPVSSYRLNVSVTDGKFTTFAPLTVNVVLISEVEVSFAVNMRIGNIDPETFVSDHMRRFIRAVAKSMAVRPKNVKLISIQPANRILGSFSTTKKRRRYYFHRRHRRSRISDENDENSSSKEDTTKVGTVSDDHLDILFAVKKSRSEGYFRPNAARTRLELKQEEIGRQSGDLKVLGVLTEVCRRDSCVKGQCIDRLTVDDTEVLTVTTRKTSFVAPKHRREPSCLCQQGFGGSKCEVPVNGCSRDPCANWELCLPMDTPTGYQCVCPPGKIGPICADLDPKYSSSCDGGDNSKCDKGTPPMSLSGNSYIRYTLSTNFERRLRLSLEIRTMARDGVIMSGSGQADYHSLRLVEGYLVYEFDAGSGVGRVRIDQVPISDGKWHAVEIIRRGRQAKMTLDERYSKVGFSKGINSILNLDDSRIVFGAEISKHPTLYGHEQISMGFIGCLRQIRIDNFELPVTKDGARMFNLAFECDDTFIAGVCSSQPCQNFGSCTADDSGGHVCRCIPRFSGANCELDLDACADEPCRNAGRCENLFNDYFCHCPSGFVGKDCAEIGSFTIDSSDLMECSTKPCGPNGLCIPSLSNERTFLCKCKMGWTGPLCTEVTKEGVSPPDMEHGNDGLGGLTWTEIIVIVVVLLILVILAIICIVLCRCRARFRYQKARYLETVNNNEMMLETNPHHIRNNMLLNPGAGNNKSTNHQNNNAAAAVSINNQNQQQHFNPSSSSIGGSPSSNPPPLPPRTNRDFHRNSKFSNLESAQMTGLPMVQVRPMSFVRNQEGYSSTESPVSCRRVAGGKPADNDRWRHNGSDGSDGGAAAVVSHGFPKKQGNNNNNNRRYPHAAATASSSGNKGNNNNNHNLQNSRNYGSAAEELEELSKYSSELMQSFAKPSAARHMGDNLRSRSSNESSESPNNQHHHHPRAEEEDQLEVDEDDWKANLHLLSMDSIERLKEEAAAAEDAERSGRAGAGGGQIDGGRSMASIQCLPEEGQGGYHWDYSDWNSTLGDAREGTDGPESLLDGAPLPTGVSALEDTDSEFVDEDDENGGEGHLEIPDLGPSIDFTNQLLALQRLTENAAAATAGGASSSKNNNGNGNNGSLAGLPVLGGGNDEERHRPPEDEYVTMRPLNTYQRHLDKYLPRHYKPSPETSRGQREPLLGGGGDGDDGGADGDDNREDSDDESDNIGSNKAVVQYGFPSPSSSSNNKGINSGKNSSSRGRVQSGNTFNNSSSTTKANTATKADNKSSVDIDSFHHNNTYDLPPARRNHRNTFDEPLTKAESHNNNIFDESTPDGFGVVGGRHHLLNPSQKGDFVHSSAEGHLSDVSGLCDIDDSEYPDSEVSQPLVDNDGRRAESKMRNTNSGSSAEPIRHTEV